MNILVTGAAGFLGRRLIEALLLRGSLTDRTGQSRPIEQIVAFDMVELTGINDPRVKVVCGDIANAHVLERLIDANTDSIFHLAAVVSSQAEADFELGMRINFSATQHMLERVRQLGTCPKWVMTSSVAVFGGQLPEQVPDNQVWAPQSSYGTQKAMNDLLLADYSRRAFVDGRSLRMPTIVVRPGKPNLAASSFASGIIREPLNGQTSVCPVPLDTRLWLMSPAQAIRNLIHGHELGSEQLTEGRVINMPGLSITVERMIDALRQTAGAQVAERIRLEPNQAIERIVGSWPGAFCAAYSRDLGFTADERFTDVIEQFIHEYQPG
ncbi:D-erythronate dehydrogenase [Pseudomonas proteolytica]|uniref:NAD-dependent epimerase/dehydratase family protein n=1 Tax=Pseudomonas proteolytica TaxID=219574 RepID=A0AAW5A6M5_9PSED|nr:D-erythronate dehydrogenase [Pseudomonas proteolytica]KAA8704067.1 SDR family oxidoreductase [Pseudomonas proteolytica]MCF5055876.1 NAD-dependent epimerase/dehydratase family protein [Pseudomonas proteolytica]MCF5103270.1 NAD-dependent epimerase/dehydratase family protein [Pseudomonas proteolytica]TWR79689.1 SDR family oxidoreductase [Pseudomonas proteolytica]SEE33422.1 Nucleoside-diphosphate-sugar epimerase [Pseudomonas proteolytica]